MLVIPLFFVSIFCCFSAVSTDFSSNSSSDSLLDSDLILSSEKTPTRAPQPVTKQLSRSKNEFAETIFQSDCSEPLNKDISCSVHIVACSDPIFEYLPAGKEPPGAHDVRIAPTTKVMGSNRIDKRKHRLHVDISWQMQQKESSKQLRAFKLQVNGPSNKETCFVFNVTQHQMDESVSPRYRFSSNTLFDFEGTYTVTIISLPHSKTKIPKVSAVSVMPDDPDVVSTQNQCTGKSNPQASKWAASFRKIFLFSVVRMIQIEFLAAPPKYCFEEYEVRLLDSSGIVMLQSAIVSKEDLKTEMIDGRPVQFGEYNFTDIELDTDLIPSVIPIETSRDGRCLCETENGCSCLAADWKPVKLAKIEKPVIMNRTTPVDTSQNGKQEASNWHIYGIVAAVAIIILFCSSLCICMSCYKKYYKPQKSVGVHFISDNPAYSKAATAPLIMKQSISVLILYSHDCAQHEATVLAFAELLRDLFNLDVHLDAWDEEEIEANRAEYINSSIVRADKVIIINSVGAYHRVVARQMREPGLERIVPGAHDTLFTNQIDLALQHVRIISVRFAYTPSKYTLFALSPLLQFSVPDNLSLLISSIAESTSRNDHRLNGFNAELAKMQAAISRMSHFIETEPDWFEKSHHRVAIAPKSLITPEPIRVEVKDEMVYPGICVKLEDIGNMEEEEEEEEEEMEEEENDSVVNEKVQLIEEVAQPVMLNGKDHGDSGNLDSAYVSGSDFSTDLHTEVLDKPRLESSKDYNGMKRKRDATVDSAFHDDVIGVH